MRGLRPDTPQITRRKRTLEFFLRPFPQRFAWKVRFLSAHKRWPASRPPVSFNEKVLWRITDDRREIIGLACDKLASKEWVARICPDLLIPEVYWSGADLSELPSVELRSRWVLKPNNGYGLVRFGEGSVDVRRALELETETAGWLDRPFEGSPGHRVEWGYTQARRCFLVEEFVGDGDLPPTDYKFRVFDGAVRQVSVIENFFGKATITVMSAEWEPLTSTRGLYEAADQPPARPASFDSMLECASRIGSRFDFIRVDLFDTSRGAAFGELTAYPTAGLMPTRPRSADVALGSHWKWPPPE